MKEERKSSLLGKILYIIILISLIFVALKLFNRYEDSNFNDFIRTEYKPYTSSFTRDSEVKYNNKASYKIESQIENDAMFYKEIEVTPNTPYRVTCMVKTENVKTVEEVSNGGANICIADTVEKSKSIRGTNDWQKLEFIFNSKNRTKVDLGFRLGTYDDNCTGIAWFSDFKIEVGFPNEDTTWNFVCFVFENTDVKIEKNGTLNNIKLQMTLSDISDMKQNMDRFKTACSELSDGKMKAKYDFITIRKPITSLSYDDKNGYYVAPKNIESLISPYLQNKNYDHIFVCLRLGDNEHQEDIPVYDWIGLGGMDYLGIGFSNIRLPNSERSYTYKYDSRINTFPEEVFIHEFLHSLERNAEEYGYERPALHDYSKYGYNDEKLVGLKKWYKDYMNSNIKTTNRYVGLNSNIYKYKPNNSDNFQFSYELEEFWEPKNIIEEIKQIIKKAFNNASTLTIKKENEI